MLELRDELNELYEELHDTEGKIDFTLDQFNKGRKTTFKLWYLLIK